MGGVEDFLEDVGGAVSDVVEGVGDAVGDLVEGVGDVIEDVADTVSDVGSWIDDNVIQPTLDDPVKTIATIAAVASGNPQLIPYINAADVAIKGGDIEDIGKAYLLSEIGRGAGSAVGSTVLQETGSRIAADAASGATRGFIGGAASGRDPLASAIVGGATGATGSAIRMGSEELFGPRAEQSGFEKFATDFTSQAARTAVGQEVAENVYDTAQRIPITGAGTTPRGFVGPSVLAAGEQPSYETKKYINDEGNVLYIQFKDGEPQQIIPPGYKEESLTSTVMLASSLPEMPANTGMSMSAAKGGLAVKKKKEKKPITSKGLAVKKK